MPTQTAMHLSEFIRAHMEDILQGWENFARTIEPPALAMDNKALRNHASHMLNAIADDLDQAQTLEQEIQKSEGHGPRGLGDTAAETHALARLLSGYTVDQLASEYRALRSSVLRLWSAHSKQGLQTDPEDITRFNEAIDQALAESLARYTALFNQSRNLFLAILGHDLRNPLGTTINGAQLLILSENLESRYRDVAIRIHNSGRRMSKLIDDLIDYTRTHLGASLPITPAPTDIAMLAKDAIDEIRVSHQGREIRLDVYGNTHGIWDGDRITQVFSNLVGNAVQHGSVNDAVTVTINAEANQLVLTFNNLGPSIPKEKLESIFEPLVRLVEGGVNRPVNKSSLGLGLYISREIVKAHDGTIHVTSHPDEGTTFTVQLPRRAHT